MAWSAGTYTPPEAPFPSGLGLPKRPHLVGNPYQVCEPLVVAPDIAPPSVSNVTPPALSDLGPTDEVGFDVTDDIGLVGLFVYVVYPDLGDWEVVHDGVQFATRFIGISTRVAILNGYRYTLKRSGGWRVAPGVDRPNIAIRIRAIDAAGNEST